MKRGSNDNIVCRIINMKNMKKKSEINIIINEK